MKKRKIILLGSSLLLSVLIGAFYFFAYDRITEESLVYIELQYQAQGQTEVEKTPGKGESLDKYRLSWEEREHLFDSLMVKEKNKMENQGALSSAEFDNDIDTSVADFSLRLVNKYGNVKAYEVYLTNEKTAYIQAKGSLYQSENPAFFFSHEGFDPYYLTSYLPDIEVENILLSKAKGGDVNWRIRRYNGSWIEGGLDRGDFSKEGKEGDFLVLQGIDAFPKASYTKEPNKISYSLINLDTNKKTEEQFSNSNNDLKLPVPEINGRYRYKLESRWEEESILRSEVIFDIQVSLPITFDVSETTIEQDDIIELAAHRAATAEDIEVVGDFRESLQWYPGDRGLSSMIATNYDTEPGSYILELVDLYNESKEVYEIEVLPRDYKTQYLTINPSIEQRTRNQEAYKEKKEYFDPVWESSSKEKHFEGAFVLPAEGRLTTEFGEQRYVNYEPTSYRHNGIDIAAPLGTEVLATNHGEVVLARKMILMGNTIVIDHGHGVLSTYMHLEEIHVINGERVNQEDTIGTVGSTGFSTGPHLHFTLSYHDRPLEPGYFIIGEPFTKEEHYQLRR